MNWGRIFNTQSYKSDLNSGLYDAKQRGREEVLKQASESVKEARAEALKELDAEYKKVKYQLEMIKEEQDRLQKQEFSLKEQKAVLVINGIRDILSGTGDSFPFRRRF